MLRYYRKDRWLQQPTLVEVLVGKKGPSEARLAVLEHFGLTFRVIHGPPVGPRRGAFADFVVAEKPCHPLRRGS